MVIDDLDFVRVAAFPPKADAPLVVDANAVLTRAIAFQLFQPVARRQPKVLQLNRDVDESELAEHGAPEVGRKPPDGLAAPESLGVSVREALDHPGIITRRVITRKRVPSLKG